MNDNNPKRFDIDHGMQIFGGEKDMLALIMDSFLDKIPEDLDALVQAVEQASVEDVERYAHRMAGAAGMVGAMRFMSLLRELEMSAKAGGLEEAESMLRGIKDEFSFFQSELKDFDWEGVQTG